MAHGTVIRFQDNEGNSARLVTDTDGLTYVEIFDGNDSTASNVQNFVYSDDAYGYLDSLGFHYVTEYEF